MWHLNVNIWSQNLKKTEKKSCKSVPRFCDFFQGYFVFYVNMSCFYHSALKSERSHDANFVVIDITKTSGATSHDRSGIMITLGFQCMCFYFQWCLRPLAGRPRIDNFLKWCSIFGKAHDTAHLTLVSRDALWKRAWDKPISNHSSIVVVHGFTNGEVLCTIRLQDLQS